MDSHYESFPEARTRSSHSASSPLPPPPPPPPPSRNSVRKSPKSRNSHKSVPSSAPASVPSPSPSSALRSPSAKAKKDHFHSVQNVILASMEENRRMRQTQIEDNTGMSNNSMILDTVEDIKTAAATTYASIIEWSEKNGVAGQQQQEDASTNTKMPSSSKDAPDSKSIMWSLSEVSKMASSHGDFTPHMEKMKKAVSKVANSEVVTDIWRFAATSKDEDDNSVGSYDTLQEEKDTIRRLGSWGTVGTAGTNGTVDSLNSLDLSRTNMEITVDLADDDGNAIDPLLLKKRQKAREKRTPKRDKAVQFDYPPIKSLKQYPRPNPEDLPNMFFTEGELDQIEDDRYSTMSTDDIEIVAVSSSKADDEPPTTTSTPSKSTPSKPISPRNKRGPRFDEVAQKATTTPGREPPESGAKSTRNRPSTPYRRRRPDDDNEEADFPAASKSKSPSNNRLVKGVQIYLRERSTGA